jgi:hypothetical protein
MTPPLTDNQIRHLARTITHHAAARRHDGASPIACELLGFVPVSLTL